MCGSKGCRKQCSWERRKETICEMGPRRSWMEWNEEALREGWAIGRSQWGAGLPRAANAGLSASSREHTASSTRKWWPDERQKINKIATRSPSKTLSRMKPGCSCTAGCIWAFSDLLHLVSSEHLTSAGRVPVWRIMASVLQPLLDRITAETTEEQWGSWWCFSHKHSAGGRKYPQSITLSVPPLSIQPEGQLLKLSLPRDEARSDCWLSKTL